MFNLSLLLSLGMSVVPQHHRSHPRVDLSSENATALDKYVHTPDQSYEWSLLNKTADEAPGVKVYTLNMTSQTWLTPEDFVGTIGHQWWHYVVVVVPYEIDDKDKALMYITGGDNLDSPYHWKGNEDIELAIALSLAVKCVGIVLFQVPNQPIIFTDDVLRHKRSEDATIAFTWDHFHRHQNETEWLLRLPMTKSAVRAMDAAEDFVKGLNGNAITSWAVAGASKRGWTTWTTAAVDSRVICIAPVVLDVLNFVKNLHHMWRAYGNWSFAFKDYHALNFTGRIDDASTAAMMEIVDPYASAYLQRYATIPKLMVDAGGDEFLMVDDNYYWYDQMPGETHLLMVQDADHSMATGLEQVVPGVSAFFKSVFTSKPRPSMKWTFGPHPNGGTGNSITLETSEPPAKVLVWHATTFSTTRRDWRLAKLDPHCTTKNVSTPGGSACLQPILWLPQTPTKVSNTTFVASFTPPVGGEWTAYFMVAEFNQSPEVPFKFKFTTQVQVTPDTMPFPDCQGMGCLGALI